MKITIAAPCSDYERTVTNGTNYISVVVYAWFSFITQVTASRHVQTYLEDCTVNTHNIIQHKCQSRWPCDLRHRFAAASLLRSLVRNPLRAWIFWCRIHLWFHLMEGLQAKSITSQRNRATYKMADIVSMVTLWQQQDGGYMLLWKRYGNNKMAARRYYGNVIPTFR